MGEAGSSEEHHREPGWLELAWRWRNRAVFGVDASSWLAATVAAALVRFEFAPGDIQWAGVVRFAAVGVVLQAVIGMLLGLYRGRYRIAAFDEVAVLSVATVLVTATATLLDVTLLQRAVPLSVALTAGPLALVVMAATRASWRCLVERAKRPRGEDRHRVVVFGAGDGGWQLITAMFSDVHGRFIPVGALDDDPRLTGRRIRGVAVHGGLTELAALVERTGADALVIAMPSATSDVIRRATEAGEAQGLQVFVAPRMSELVDGRLGVTDIRQVTYADLLGRSEVKTDLVAIAGYLTGKRVLVTGAGGSIGSELCRQLHRLAPAELVMLDRDESGLHATQLDLEGRALLDDRNLVVADIRDQERLHEVFREHRPHVVFHAAALKHLPLLEMHPGEAVKTNVYGTLHVLEAAKAAGVETFVNISTDKAADPISVLGRTKRSAEQLTAHFAECSPGTWVSVRFGNVLGSRGSVLTTFEQQIASGGPLTVTHPDITRYFMTVEEAVQLVIQAGAIGTTGHVLILDMGQAIRIEDVARRLITQAGRPIDIVYTGLRPGEKLHEQLFTEDERTLPTSHPLVSQCAVDARSHPLLDAAALLAQA